MIPGFSKRERTLVIGVASLVFASLLYIFLVEPVIKRYGGTGEQIEAKRLKLKKASKLLKQKEQVSSLFQELSGIVKSGQGSQEEEMAELLSEIENLARESNIRISGMKPLSIKEISFYKKYTVEIDSEGSIEELMKFLHAVQASPQVLKVEQLELTSKSGAQGSLKVSLLINKLLID